VYVATSLFNADQARNVASLFESHGITITYKWYEHGQLFDEQELADCGEAEEKGVVDCDLFFLIHPARYGAHCELGMARVLGKKIVILEPEPIEKKTFYYRPAGHPRPIYRFRNQQEAVDFAINLLRDSRDFKSS